MLKPTPTSPFIGSWHIVSMSSWEDDYLNEEVQAFIKFEEDGTGNFQFGYVSGCMDWRSSKRVGALSVAWTWEGGDGADGTLLNGRGSSTLSDDGLRGMIFIHLGDESEFEAERTVKPPSKPKKPKR